MNKEKQEVLLKQYEILHNKINHIQNKSNELTKLCVIIYLTVLGFIGVIYVNFYKVIENSLNSELERHNWFSEKIDEKTLKAEQTYTKTLKILEQAKEESEQAQSFQTQYQSLKDVLKEARDENNKVAKSKLQWAKNNTKLYKIAIYSFAIFILVGFICYGLSIFFRNKKLKQVYNKLETIEKSLNVESVDKYNKYAGYTLFVLFSALTVGFVIVLYI